MSTTDDRITRAALRLFAARGFEATGIRDIAEAVNLSSAALYHYMGTKDDLLLRIMCDSLTRWLAGLDWACSEMPAPEQKLVALVRLHVMYEGRYRLKSVVVDNDLRSLHGRSRAKVIALRDQYEGILADILAAGRAEGTFEIADPRLTRLALLEMCNGVSRWYSRTGASTLEEIADRFADMALALVRARKEGRRLTLRDIDLPPSSYYLKIAVETSEGPLAEPRRIAAGA